MAVEHQEQTYPKSAKENENAKIQYGPFKSLYPRQILSFGFRSKILGHPKKPPQMNPKMKKRSSNFHKCVHLFGKWVFNIEFWLCWIISESVDLNSWNLRSWLLFCGMIWKLVQNFKFVPIRSYSAQIVFYLLQVMVNFGVQNDSHGSEKIFLSNSLQ